MATLTGLDFYKKFGDPSKKKFINSLVIWDVPEVLEIGFVPKRIYCHPMLVEPLRKSFIFLRDRECVHELKTWDGCWNLRPKRGYEKKYERLVAAGRIEEAIDCLSIHSWAGAFDVNAAENPLSAKPKLSKGFVKCFTDSGFEWGGNWTRQDGMHFQLATL